MNYKQLTVGTFFIGFYLQNHLYEGMYTFISYYDHLSYNTDALEQQHDQSRLISPSDGRSTVNLHFYSHGRNFHLNLVHDDTIFHSGFVIENSQGKHLTSDISHLYHGSLFGDNSSVVYGSIINGVFRGVIAHSEDGTYYVEESKTFFRDAPTSIAINLKKGHSVMYHQSAVKFPNTFHSQNRCKVESHDMDETRMFKNSYTEEKKIENDISLLRKKRQANQIENTTCLLHIQTDHLFFEYADNSVEIAIARVAEHIKAATTIFSSTPFTVGGKEFKKLKFKISKLKINDSASLKDINNPFRFQYIGVEKYLNLLSTFDYDRYCLSYAFTYRDFDDGILGLAWVASTSSTGGGICEMHRAYDKGQKRSLNTGLVTFLNYGSTVPSYLSQLTFAHELGHSLGSPHDSISNSECSPGGESSSNVGNFLMYPRSTNGLQQNNDKFSPCSIKRISAVLEIKKDRCFVPDNFPICGNQIVDNSSEECDCGFKDDCEKLGDTCCNPADTPNECKLKSGADCSFSQGVCCTKDCKFANTAFICLNETDCHKSVSCDGRSAKCPDINFSKNDGQLCRKGTRTCKNGGCTGSICLSIPELEPCLCSVPAGTANRSTLCHACCQIKGKPDSCASTGSAVYKKNFPSGLTYLQPGSACDNFNGYCDFLTNCRMVDAEGPLARITNALFNPELYRGIFAWITDYWWAVCLMMFGFIVSITLFVKIFNVNTPTHNPKVTKKIAGVLGHKHRPHRKKRIHPRVDKHNAKKHASNNASIKQKIDDSMIVDMYGNKRKKPTSVLNSPKAMKKEKASHNKFGESQTVKTLTSPISVSAQKTVDSMELQDTDIGKDVSKNSVIDEVARNSSNQNSSGISLGLNSIDFMGDVAIEDKIDNSKEVESLSNPVLPFEQQFDEVSLSDEQLSSQSTPSEQTIEQNLPL